MARFEEWKEEYWRRVVDYWEQPFTEEALEVAVSDAWKDGADSLKSDLKLERAAALREVQEKLESKIFPIGTSDISDAAIMWDDVRAALIPQAEAHALDKLLAEARLEEAEWWAEWGMKGDQSHKRLAALRAAVGKDQP
jgi:hypothetical protein